jgi:hypothetical protein
MTETISRQEFEHSEDVSIRDAGESGVWLYVDGSPVKHVTPNELHRYVEEA